MIEGVQRQALLRAAARLEELADKVPVWRPDGGERWDLFLARQHHSETALAAFLRRVPACRLWMCPHRWQVNLVLCGIRIHCDGGLAAACRAWAQKARRRLEAPRLAETAGCRMEMPAPAIPAGFGPLPSRGAEAAPGGFLGPR